MHVVQQSVITNDERIRPWVVGECDVAAQRQPEIYNLHVRPANTAGSLTKLILRARDIAHERAELERLSSLHNLNDDLHIMRRPLDQNATTFHNPSALSSY